MSNNLTLSVTLTGDGKQLSGTLKNAQGDVREFSAATERESKKAETALEAPGRQAGTVSEHLRGAQREARTFGTETAQGGRQATQALTQAGNEAQTTAGHLNQLKAVAIGVGVAFTAMGVREFINDTYAAVSSSQQLQASLKTVTGSLGSATKAWDELLVFAAETPFTLDQSVQAFIRMQALGLNPTQAALRSFGNTAAAMGEDMMRMVEAVADATTGEFERLKAFGIRSAVEGDQIAFTFQGVTTRIRNSAADISAYLQSIGENQFAGAMADQMATLSGQSANLEDSIYQLYLAIGEAGATNVFASGLRAVSNTVQFLTDNIDTLVSGAEVMAVLIGGRVVVALTTATAAKLAATQQTIAYQLALARMSGVSATAAAGQVALAGATRASAGALALVGGPLGAAMLAGGAIYYFREELGLVTPKVQSATERVDDMTSALDANSEAALKNAKAMLEAEQQFQQFRQATLAMDVSRQRQIVADEQKQWDAIGGHDAFGAGPRSESQQALQDLQVELMNTRNAIDAAGGSVTEIDEKLAKLERTTRETITPTTGLGEANKTAAAQAKELAKATEAQADALEDLYDRLIPGRRETVQLARDMQTLTLAMAMGTGNIGQNIQAMGLLQQQYIEAQNDTDDLADKTVKAAYTMEGAWDEVRLNGLRRLDDGFASLWEGAIDGSLNAGELMKKALAQTLAEMAHMAITRPITVQLATSMGLNGGAGGSAGGGFNGIGSLINGGKSLLGIGSSSTAAAAGGLYSGASTGAAVGGLYGNAVTGGVASTGIMSSITAGVSAAMPWIAGGLAIDSLLGGGITKAIGKLFGGGDTPFYGEVGSGSGIKAYRTETALGETGFTQRQRIEKATSAGTQEWAAELFEASKALDTIIASTARSTSELDAMKGAVNNFKVASGDASKLIQAQLVDRTLVALEAAGHNVTAAWGNLGAEELAARIEQASGAMSVMSASSERLNLQFDVTSSSALRAADNMAQYAGGVQNLASLQDQYFQRYFSDTERAAALQADLTASLNAMGLALPRNEAGFRALVEAQDQNTDAGGRNYVQLLQLSNGFAQLQDMLGQTETGVRDFTAELSAARAAVSTAEDQVRRAYEVFDRQQYGMQLELLELMGDAEGALALERERELATIDEALRPMRERIWAMQDEAEAQERATKAAQNYIGELTRVRDQLNQQLGNIGNWLDQQQATSGTPQMNLATAQEQLARQLVLIENGDRDALQNITQYAQQVLDANRDYNASSAAGQRIQQDVYDAIAGLPAAINAEQYLADEIKAALREQTQGISTQLGDVLRGDNPSSIAANLAGHFTTLAGGIDGVLTREQLAIVMSGKATDEQLTALMRSVDLNGDGVISGLESVIIAGMPTDAVLGTVLRNKMSELDKNQLTHAQIRSALSPIASDAEIARLIREVDLNGDGMVSQQELANQRLAGLAGGIGTTLAPMFDRIDLDASGLIDWTEFHGAFAGMASDAEIARLIREVDVNGDGMISQQELANQRLAGLAGGIGTTLAPMFDRIDLDASGLIDWTEFHGAFAGMASDDELRRIFDKLDADGSGTISRLEALNRSNEGTEANTDSMEKQARDQLRELNGLVGEMTRTTDQFVGLNSTMVSLREAILALGVAQDDIARIEEERAAAEQAERDRIERERQQSQLAAQRNSLQNQIGDYQGRINSLQGAASGISVSTASIEGSLDWRHGAQNIQNTAQTYLNAHGVSQSAADRFLAYFTTGAGANADRGQYAPGGIFRTYINDYADEIANTANARGTITELNRQIAELQRELKNLPSVNGSHRTGLEYVPFDGYLAELHRGEKVLTAEDADAMRNVSRPQLPPTPAPHFPLLGNNDIVETLRDLKREVQELRKENALLQRESNKHLAAANNQRGAAAKGQIGAIERGNRMLKKMEDEKRLEAAKR